jgi:hypothetical protein
VDWKQFSSWSKIVTEIGNIPVDSRRKRHSPAGMNNDSELRKDENESNIDQQKRLI